MAMEKTLRTCEKGHEYYKSSDCPTCPDCEKEKKPKTGFLSLLSSPARNALQHHGIHTIEELSKYSEKEILKLHGMVQHLCQSLERLWRRADYHLNKMKQ